MTAHRSLISTVVAIALLVTVGSHAAAQEPPHTVEATLIDSASQTLLAIGGPWAWEAQAWSIFSVPPGVELDLLVTLRDVEGIPVFEAEWIGFTVDPGLVGPVASLDLFIDGGGIHLMSGPLADLGVAPLVRVNGVAELVIDIKPGSDDNPVNLNSRGLLPVALVGTETIDVSTVDPASFVLDDIAPLRWHWADVSSPDRSGPDGVTDLVFFFDSTAVGAALAAFPHGSEAGMALEGIIADGQFGAGGDTVRIITKADARGRTE